jgi:hypothetical protein
MSGTILDTEKVIRVKGFGGEPVGRVQIDENTGKMRLFVFNANENMALTEIHMLAQVTVERGMAIIRAYYYQSAAMRAQNRLEELSK